jgi:hypothetical protein
VWCGGEDLDSVCAPQRTINHEAANARLVEARLKLVAHDQQRRPRLPEIGQHVGDAVERPLGHLAKLPPPRRRPVIIRLVVVIALIVDGGGMAEERA